MQKTFARFISKSLPLFLLFLLFLPVSPVTASPKVFSLAAVIFVKVVKTDTSFLDLFFEDTWWRNAPFYDS